MMASLLAALLGLLGLSLLFGHDVGVLFHLLQHLLELPHHFPFDALDAVPLYFLGDAFQLLHLPPHQQSSNLVGEVVNPDIFTHHVCHVCEVWVVAWNLLVFCDVLPEVWLGDGRLFLVDDVDE